MFDVLHAKIVLITGERQVGKSTALYRSVSQLCDADFRVSGLLTRRTGPHDLEVTEVHAGATYTLTDPFTPTHTSPTRHFAMSAAALRRSGEALAASFPTDIFVLDELGPLELVHRQGWVGALDLLRHEVYTVAFVVVRPELLGAVIAELPGPGFGLIRVTPDNREALPDQIFRLVARITNQRERTGPAQKMPEKGNRS